MSSEKFDDPWYEGEAVGTALFVEKDSKTTLTITVRYDSKEIRDSVLESPMDQGMVASFDNLDEVLASMPAGGVT